MPPLMHSQIGDCYNIPYYSILSMEVQYALPYCL